MKLLSFIIALVVIFVTVMVALSTHYSSCGRSNHLNASSTMKTLGTAEADFRSNDRDGNGTNDYWTQDVAGLALICPPGLDLNISNSIKLIEISLAAGDADFGGNNVRYSSRLHVPPVKAFLDFQAKAGYHFARLLGDSASRYGQGEAERFGFAAFPASRHDRLAFITNQDNVQYHLKLPATYQALAWEVGPPQPTTFQITGSGSRTLEQRCFPEDPVKAGWTRD